MEELGPSYDHNIVCSDSIKKLNKETRKNKKTKKI